MKILRYMFGLLLLYIDYCLQSINRLYLKLKIDSLLKKTEMWTIEDIDYIVCDKLVGYQFTNSCASGYEYSIIPTKKLLCFSKDCTICVSSKLHNALNDKYDEKHDIAILILKIADNAVSNYLHYSEDIRPSINSKFLTRLLFKKKETGGIEFTSYMTKIVKSIDYKKAKELTRIVWYMTFSISNKRILDYLGLCAIMDSTLDTILSQYNSKSPEN